MTVVFSPGSAAPLRAFAPKKEQWNILCDFDGAVTPFDVTSAIVCAFAHPSREEAEAEWLAGRITARERMHRQVGLIRTPAVILDAWLDEIPLTAGFLEFTRLCRARGLRLVVVGDGLDHAIRRILARHGLSHLPIIANRLRYKGNSAWRLEFPRGAEGCPAGVCKCEVARALGGDTLLIGAGGADCCAAGSVSMIFARRGRELARHCAANGLSCLEFDDFYDVAELLRALISDETARPAENADERKTARPAESIRETARPAENGRETARETAGPDALPEVPQQPEKR